MTTPTKPGDGDRPAPRPEPPIEPVKKKRPKEDLKRREDWFRKRTDPDKKDGGPR